MKKIISSLFVFLFLTSFAFSFSLVAANPFAEVEEGIREIEETKQKVEDKSYWEEKWDYLGKEWNKIFMENKIISLMNDFFSKITIFFRIVVGMHYSFSFLFFGVLFLWLCVFFEVGRFIRSGGFIENVFSYPLAALFAVMLAQIQFFRVIVQLTIKVIAYPEHKWTRFFLFVILIVLILLLKKFDDFLDKLLKEMKKNRDEGRTNLAKKSLVAFSENLKKTSETDTSLGFLYAKGMRRGGEKSTKGRFVSKKATERYSRRFGDDAANKRFG
jgi:hypothetical protein